MSSSSSFATCIRRSLRYSATTSATINNHTADSSFIFRRSQRQAFFFSSSSSISSSSLKDFFNPTDTHVQLRSMLRDFVQNEVRTLLLLLGPNICWMHYTNILISQEHPGNKFIILAIRYSFCFYFFTNDLDLTTIVEWWYADQYQWLITTMIYLFIYLGRTTSIGL